MSLKPNAILLCSALVAALVASSGAALAQDPAPADRCTGTFCDLYYGGPPPEQSANAKPAAPKPLMVPRGGVLGMFGGNGQAAGQPGQPGAPATRPMVGVGGGGLAAMARGEKAERCSGTLCDLYYGGPPPEPAPGQPADAAAAPQAAPATTADAGEPDEAEPAVRYQEPRREPARCAAGKDPWSCYR